VKSYRHVSFIVKSWQIFYLLTVGNKNGSTPAIGNFRILIAIYLSRICSGSLPKFDQIFFGSHSI